MALPEAICLQRDAEPNVLNYRAALAVGEMKLA
jgi:hypothetical protein